MKTKELKEEIKKDIVIMLCQFIGAFIVFVLVLNSSLLWITGKVVLIGNIIYYSFIGLGILLPVILMIIMSIIILKEKK